MTNKRIKQIINAIHTGVTFDTIVDFVIDEVGDEGNDVGDSGNVIELIANSTINHDIDTRPVVRRVIINHMIDRCPDIAEFVDYVYALCTPDRVDDYNKFFNKFCP